MQALYPVAGLGFYVSPVLISKDDDTLVDPCPAWDPLGAALADGTEAWLLCSLVPNDAVLGHQVFDVVAVGRCGVNGLPDRVIEVLAEGLSAITGNLSSKSLLLRCHVEGYPLGFA